MNSADNMKLFKVIKMTVNYKDLKRHIRDPNFTYNMITSKCVAMAKRRH